MRYLGATTEFALISNQLQLFSGMQSKIDDKLHGREAEILDCI